MKKLLAIITLVFSLMIVVSCNHPNNKECLHQHTSWVVVESATCLKEGTKQLVCDDCGNSLTTAIIPVTSHEAVIDPAVDATCENDGLTEGSHCKYCNQVLTKQVVITKKGHHYVLDVALSTTNKNVYKCDCGATYEAEKQGNECSEHETSEWKVIKEPTCSEQGIKQKVCIHCNVMLEQANIEMIDHTESILPGKDASCGVTGLTEGIICSVCQKVIKEQTEIPALEHQYEVTKVVNPTANAKGYIEYTCTICNDSYQKELAELGDYDESKSTEIILNDNNILINNNNGGVIVTDSQIEITLSGEYDISGTLTNGNIIVRLAESDKATLNLKGVNLSSTTTHPIFIESGDKVDISATSGTINIINDQRPIASSTDTGAAIYAKTDLTIKGKGVLNIESSYNNGIGTTKDLKIKNLNLTVNVPNNAIKGNDSITIEAATIKAISSSGDALKTENSDVSSKGNQRGIVHIISGTLDLYAACDGIDASYQVLIDDGNINIYTEKYSEYSGDVSITTAGINYLGISNRLNLNGYTYSAMFITESGDTSWSNGVLESNNRNRYYKFEVPTDAKYVKYFAYSSSQTQGQNTTYTYVTDQLTLNTAYDTYYINSTRNTYMSGNWTNYSSNNMGGPGGMPGGPGGMPGGGMQDGNSDKALYSCKGIKADNDIIINGGTIKISSHDDGIHTNSDVLLETNVYGTGDVTINGGSIEITSDDDGIHADHNLTINDGNIIIKKSYEGLEGDYIYINGGTTQIKASDDGINSLTTLYIENGFVYLDADGDGIDSNGSVYMSGGIVLALGPTNGGNGVLDIGERGCTFSFSGGLLLAVGCSGMDVAPTGTSGNTVSASRVTSSQNSYLTVTSGSKTIAVLKITKSNQTYRVFAYNNATYPSATLTTSSSTSVTLTNGLYYVNPN